MQHCSYLLSDSSIPAFSWKNIFWIEHYLAHTLLFFHWDLFSVEELIVFFTLNLRLNQMDSNWTGIFVPLGTPNFHIQDYCLSFASFLRVALLISIQRSDILGRGRLFCIHLSEQLSSWFIIPNILAPKRGSSKLLDWWYGFFCQDWCGIPIDHPLR